MNNTEPLPLPLFAQVLDVSNSTPPNSSTPSVFDFKASKASVSYQLDMSGTSNSSTPGSVARTRRQKRLDEEWVMGQGVNRLEHNQVQTNVKK